jgi:hypothetical protein
LDFRLEAMEPSRTLFRDRARHFIVILSLVIPLGLLIRGDT